LLYRTIVADPPWPYSSTGAHLPDRSGGRNADGRGANVSSSLRYGALSIDALRALRPPVADAAHLYLWTTNSFVVEAHEIAQAWGFAPKTICTWTKVKADGSPSMKAGYYFRGATEHCLFAVRGSMRLQVSRGLPTAWLWPREPHSVKPDAFYDLVREASPGPYLELFARRPRIGWDQAGDQSAGTVHVPGLRAPEDVAA